MVPAMLRLLHVLRFVGLVSLNSHTLLLRGIDVRRVHEDGRPRFRVYFNIVTPCYAKAATRLAPAAASPSAPVASPRRRVVQRASPTPVLAAFGAFVTSHVTARRGARPAPLQSPTPSANPRLALGAAARKLPRLHQPARRAEPPPPRRAARRLPLLADCLPDGCWLVAVGGAAMAHALLSPCAAVSGVGSSLTVSACACAALGGLASLGEHPHAALKVALLAGAAGALLSFCAPTVGVLARAHLASSLSAAVLPLAQAWAVRRVCSSYAGSPNLHTQRTIAIASQLGCLGAWHDLALAAGGALARHLLLGLRGSLSPDSKLRLLFLAACAAAAIAAVAGLAACRLPLPLPRPTQDGSECCLLTDMRAGLNARSSSSLGARPPAGCTRPQPSGLLPSTAHGAPSRYLSRRATAATHRRGEPALRPAMDGPLLQRQSGGRAQLDLLSLERMTGAHPWSTLVAGLPAVWRVPAAVAAAACVGVALASLELQLPTPTLDLRPLLPANRRILPDLLSRLVGPAALVLFLCCGTSLDALLWLAFALAVASSALCSFSAGVRAWHPASPLPAQLRSLLLLASAHAAELAAVAGVAILSPGQAGALSLGCMRAAWLLVPAARMAAAGGRRGGATMRLPPPSLRIGPIEPPRARARGGRAAPVRPPSRPARSAPPLRFTSPKKARPAVGAR
jgi:hypothetical protein